MGGKVIVIAGPTCSGKSDLALQLARKLKSEIISADSRQVFKYLNIGTAKPGRSELSVIKHHFIDELDPAEDFNVSKFENRALKIIDDLFERDINPIVAGGSGLYIKALIDGIFDEVDTDEEYRKLLHEWKNKYGNEYLYEKLTTIDPVSAEKMLPQNWKRVMRALEVFHLTGKPIWQFHQKYEREERFNFVQFGIEWERSKLYDRINNRVESMIADGLVDEVKKILEMGYSSNLNSLITVGYKEIIEYMSGSITLERAIELIKRNTRRYAKRQLTWFRKDERIEWIKFNDDTDFSNVADYIIHKSNIDL